MMKSLETHDRHERLGGFRHHFARHVACAVSEGIGARAVGDALCLHRAAGRAKHQGPPLTQPSAACGAVDPQAPCAKYMSQRMTSSSVAPGPESHCP